MSYERLEGNEGTTQTEQTKWKQYIKDILSLSWPILLSSVCFNNIGLIVMLFTGKLGGSAELSGVGLAMAWADLTVYTVSSGIETGTETFMAQAYGHGNKKGVGRYLQKSLILYGVYAVCLVALNTNADIILILVGQDPVLACITRRFQILANPGYVLILISRVLYSYFKVIHATWSIVLIPGLGSLTLVVTSYSLLDYGVDGIAMAQNACFAAMIIADIIYMCFSAKCKETWPGWSMQIFTDWGPLVKLCIAGAVMSGAEVLFLMILTIVAGTLGEVPLAAQSIVFQLYFVATFALYSITDAGGIKIGIALGANNGDQAKNYIKATLTVAFIGQIISSSPFLLFCHKLIHLFNDDERIATLGSRLLILVAIVLIAESIFRAFYAAVKASARQTLASVVNLVCLYVIGLPLLFVVIYKLKDGLQGSWLIYGGVYTLMAVIFGLTVVCSNWQNEAAKAQERVRVTHTQGVENSDDANSAWAGIGPVFFHKVALISAIIVPCLIILSLNLTGVISLNQVYGTGLMTSVNATSVSSCRYLISDSNPGHH